MTNTFNLIFQYVSFLRVKYILVLIVEHLTRTIISVVLNRNVNVIIGNYASNEVFNFYQPKTSLVLPRYLTFFVHVQFFYILTLDRLILVFSIDASFHCYKKKLLPRQKIEANKCSKVLV